MRWFPSNFVAAVAIAACALILFAPALAQTPEQFPRLAVGQGVQGSLSPTAEHRYAGSPFAVYRVELLADQRYAVTSMSPSFSPHLMLMRPAGGLTEVVREDGYAEIGQPARMRLRVDEAGTYLVVVRSSDAYSTGSFTVVLEELADPPPAEPHPIAAGERVSGELGEMSPVYLTDWDSEVPHDLYSIRGEAGQTLIISMESDEFDSYLELGHLINGGVDVFAFDDDGGDGLNALLRVRLPADGTYGIIARAFSETHSGRYTLSVAERGEIPIVRRTITSASEAHGELTHDDADLDDGNYFQEWAFEGRAGQTASIRMRSDEFDTFVYLGRYVAGDFEIIDQNDDAPDDGTNSLIVYTLPTTGEYVIRATSLWGRRVGPYTVSLDLD